ncbi:MAG: cysteine peptidase family C39 domain-containing protein, partial [Eubacteriales bacterium]|nr:cysteine peptidase family C39 domain-containing protein [Eubacteriales bacterium]
MKKIKFELIVTFTVVAAVIGGCGTGAADKKPAAQIQELPALHEIPVPEGYPTTQDDLGADAFAHEGDHADSRYYIFNDYYNMESGGTLHIIPEFRTYQQTTEYSCGPCAALMVLEHFGIKDKDELQLAEELHTDTAKGTDPADMARYFEGLGWNTESHADYT